MLIQKLALWGDKHQLCGGGARVYAEKSLALVFADIRVFQVELPVARHKAFVLLLRAEKGLTRDYIVFHLGVFQTFGYLVNWHRLAGIFGVKSAAVRHKAGCVFRKYCVLVGKFQRVHKRLTKPLLERKRPAQKEYLAFYFTTLGKS